MPGSNVLAREPDDYQNPGSPSFVNRPQFRPPNALLRYGDQTIIPAPEDMPEAAINVLHQAGEAAMAFPPGALMAEPAIAAVNMLSRTPRAATGLGMGRATTDQASEQAMQALSDEMSAKQATAQSLAARAATAADTEARARAIVQAARDRAQLSETNAAENAQRGQTPSGVPAIDGVTPMRDQASAMDTLKGNPFVQAIPGRQGFPSKAEQVELAKRFFDNGGRLSSGGPWGRSMVQEVQNLLEQQARREANFSHLEEPHDQPGIKDVLDAWKQSQGEASSRQNLIDETYEQLKAMLEKSRSATPPGDAGQPGGGAP